MVLGVLREEWGPRVLRVSMYLQQIKDIYGENLAEKVGTVHNHLGMTFDYSFDDKVRINMNQYISKVIKEFPQGILEISATPAADHLYKIWENGKTLNEEPAEAFHHTTYQLLFVANRAQCDIQMAVSFLTTRVQEPNEDDWAKLMQVLWHLNGTRHLTLILREDAINFAIHWYIDALYQVHEDFREQIGCLMTLGRGAVISSSNKMKCNTKSSTRTELIAFHDKLPDVIWTRCVVECQG